MSDKYQHTRLRHNLLILDMQTANKLWKIVCTRIVQCVIRTIRSHTKVVELDCTIFNDFENILLQPFDVDLHILTLQVDVHCRGCWIKTRLPSCEGHMKLMSSWSILSLHKDRLWSTEDQWLGKFLRIIIGWDPSVCKSNRLHDDILRISFIKLGYIL